LQFGISFFFVLTWLEFTMRGKIMCEHPMAIQVGGLAGISMLNPAEFTSGKRKSMLATQNYFPHLFRIGTPAGFSYSGCTVPFSTDR
jgi:hypothetical protein